MSIDIIMSVVVVLKVVACHLPMKRAYECNKMHPKTPKLVNKLRYKLLKNNNN